MNREKIRELIRPGFFPVFKSLIYLPKKFLEKFGGYIVILLPLIFTQFLIKIQDLIDDRYMAFLGKEALSIHNIQYNFFTIGQEIGLVAATSALIFWKRKETQGQQGSILLRHFLLPAGLSTVVCFGLYFFIPNFIDYFQIQKEFSALGVLYLKLGLFNLFLRSLYVPMNALLIASDQRVKSIFLIAGIILFKWVAGWASTSWVWNHQNNSESLLLPMLIIELAATLALLISLPIGSRFIVKIADGWKQVSWKSLFLVWPGELGIGLISAFSPILFGFQVAQAQTTAGFFVTYQLALHLTTILTLPVLAGMQIAVRDASAEHSENPGVQFKPLHEARWWPLFFYGSLAPSLILLLCAVAFHKSIFKWIYSYSIPIEHLKFLPAFFVGWMFWQWGSVFLVMLRASQKNGLATRNFVIAGLGIQVGITQLLISFKLATPINLGLVIAAYCFTYLVLNWKAIFEIQSRYYFVKARSLFKSSRRKSLSFSKKRTSFKTVLTGSNT